MFLVRHGQTEWSRTGRHTSRTDIPVEAAGRVQAAEIGHRLKGRVLSLVLSSPKQRALETAQLAGMKHVEVTDDLLEWDYGDFEGLTTPQIRAEHPAWTLWEDGAPGGESPSDVGRRADRVVERARSAGGDVVCFAHGHVLRVVAARWIGLPPSGGSMLFLDAGSLSVLGWEREVPVVVRWNEVERSEEV
jgi:broad specificity phosphatase PhoE